MLAPTYNEVNPIVVTTGGQTITATENFRLLPTVTDFSPKSGTFGTIINCHGQRLLSFFNVCHNWRKARVCITGNRHLCDVYGPATRHLPYAIK